MATEQSGDAPTLERVLKSAARLQRIVPDAVLVGGSAAALHAGHRLSFDHDHVLEDLQDRFDIVLEALESEGEWVTNRVVPGKLVLGRLGEIEAGVRQLIRRRPLEIQSVEVSPGERLRVPTVAEILRIKAFLAVRRNQTRDYLDVAGISDVLGVVSTAGVLSGIDAYYADEKRGEMAVASQVVRQLAAPAPKDSSVTRHLESYRELKRKWHKWSDVVTRCQAIADAMLMSTDTGGEA